MSRPTRSACRFCIDLCNVLTCLVHDHHDHKIPTAQAHMLPSSDLSVPRHDPNDLGCMGGNLSAVHQDHLYPISLLDMRHTLYLQSMYQTCKAATALGFGLVQVLELALVP